MSVNNSGDSFVTSSKAVFFCPNDPLFVWDLENKVSLQLIIAITAIAAPFTTFLNILVIVTIQKTRELQTNSSILISSLAITDVLVGAVSTPLIITVDALILRGTVPESIVCKINHSAAFVQYIAYSASYMHLILMGWERYIAIAKPTKYKVLVRKQRIKRYSGIIWITIVILYVLVMTLQAIALPHEFVLVLHFIEGVVWLVGFMTLVYFYSMVYSKARKQSRSQISQISQISTKIQSRIAFTAFLLTAAVFIFSLPIPVVIATVQFWPILRANSVFRWSEVSNFLNSLLNPVLYFYRNRRYRKAALKLLRFRMPLQTQSVGPCTRWCRDSFVPVDEKYVCDTERTQCLPRSQSWAADTHGRLSIMPGMQNKSAMERRFSCPPLLSYENLREVIQPVTQTITVQIELTPRNKLARSDGKHD